MRQAGFLCISTAGASDVTRSWRCDRVTLEGGASVRVRTRGAGTCLVKSARLRIFSAVDVWVRPHHRLKMSNRICITVRNMSAVFLRLVKHNYGWPPVPMASWRSRSRHRGRFAFGRLRRRVIRLPWRLIYRLGQGSLRYGLRKVTW
jgi:hypothetical protein